MHGFACAGVACSGRASARTGVAKSGIAPALKPPHEAGGRGGESTARNDVSLRASGMGTLHSFIFVINCLSYKCLFFERHVVCYME